MKVGLVLITLASSACVKQSYVPTITVYSCAAQRAQLVTILNMTQPPLPSVIQLPSGERVYVGDNLLAYHYDGPVCRD